MHAPGLPPSDDAAFVVKVEQALAAAERDQAAATLQFIEVGRMLLERKEAGKRNGSIPHGQWVSWLERNFPPRNGKDRVRRLQHYMQAAEAIDTGDEATKTKLSSFLPEGLNAVLDEVRNLKRPERPDPKPIPLTGDVTAEKLQILIGDCRARIRELPDTSVHCCITSPPYFGLRSYLSNFDFEGRPPGNDVRRWVNSGEKSIWGGDQKNCEHDWTGHQRPGMNGGTNSEKVQIKGQKNFQAFAASEYSVCRKCGAWYGALGLEPTPELYVEHICEVFDEVWRVLRDDGTCWIVIGDSYSSGGQTSYASDKKNPARRMECRPDTPPGMKPKDLIGVPWMVGVALRARGWYLRSEICWEKPDCMPEPVADRPVKSNETIFLLTKQPNYHYDHEAIKEPAISIDDPRKGNRQTYNGKFGSRAFAVVSPDNKRNCRNVWTIPTSSFSGDHFAPFPKALVKPMVLAGCPEGGTVLDVFAGSGTTGLVANALGRRAVLIDANAEYCAIARERIDKELPRYTAKANSTDAWGNPKSVAAAPQQHDIAAANDDGVRIVYDSSKIIQIDGIDMLRRMRQQANCYQMHHDDKGWFFVRPSDDRRSPCGSGAGGRRGLSNK